MKRLLGIFIVSQTILFGIIAYQILELSDSIKQSASLVAHHEGTLGWGGNLPNVSLYSLVILIVLGLYLIISKERKK